MSSWGSPLLDPKKLQNEQFYIIDWRRKKLLVDVANLAPCCHDDYDVLLEVLGTLGKCYVSNPVAKTLVWIENHDWHNCFCMSSWGSPLLDPKKLQNEQFYIVDWIRKNSWSMLPIWLLAAMMIMMYYWRFWEPWANAMLAILLPKLWFGLKIMTGTTVFACLPGAHPYWTQKSFKTNSFRFWEPWANAMLDQEFSPYCQNSGYGLKIMTGTSVFVCLPVGSPLLWAPGRQLQNEQFYQ